MNAVEFHEGDISDEWVEQQSISYGRWVIGDREGIGRAIHKFTKDETRCIVLGVPDDVWNASRRLCEYFNLSLAAMEDRVWGDFGILSHQASKNPEETKILINELSIRIEMVESITGEKVVSSHAKSMLLTFLDPLT